MTEKDFLKQVWRPYDKITTADGVPGKVLGVSFTTKSVRAFISGAPEWVSCTLIETHTTGKGDDVDPLIHRLFGERVEGNVLIAPHLSVPAKREAA